MIEMHNLDIIGLEEVDIKDFDITKPFSIEGFKTFFAKEKEGSGAGLQCETQPPQSWPP